MKAKIVADLLLAIVGITVVSESAAATMTGEPCTKSFGSSYGATIEGTSGQFSSPAYDGATHYDTDIRCRWLIKTPNDTRVLLEFLAFDVEKFADCLADYVIAYSGEEISSTRIGKTCGKLIPAPLLSEENVLMLTFTSDTTYTDLGFVANFTAVHENTSGSGCGGLRHVKKNTTISTPGFPSKFSSTPGGVCIWEVEAPDGKLILFDFIDLAMAIGAGDELRIYDGPERGISHHQAYHKSETPKNAKVISSGNRATVALEMFSEEAWVGNGFLTYVRFIEPSDVDSYETAINLKLKAYDGLCGLPNVTYIADTAGASRNTWPWQVNLRNRSQPSTNIFCGGTIVARAWVVTAGQCYSYSPIYVFAGDYDLLYTDYEMQISLVERKILHENFIRNGTTWVNDIALLKLSQPFMFTDYVRPACIPSIDIDFEEGTLCYMTGWGRLHPSTESGFRILQQLSVTLLSHEDCTSVFRENFTDAQICGGYQPGVTDTCRGDPGGPLVCRKPGKLNWVLYGIVSWGWKCSETSPGVYTRVSEFAEWIETQTEGWAQINYNNSGPMPTHYPTTAPIAATKSSRMYDTSTAANLVDNASSATVSINITEPLPYCTSLTSITGGRGNITSPGYPDNYEHSSNCTWMLQGKHTASMMRVNFRSDLRVLSDRGCDENYVLVKRFDLNDITWKTQKYCRSSANIPDVLENSLEIIFVPGPNQGGWTADVPGFSAEYHELDPCDGNTLQMEGEEDVIVSPNFPRSYPQGVTCIWKLPSFLFGTEIKIRFFDLPPESNGQCSDRVEISSQDRATVLCGKIFPTVINMNSTVTILFRSTATGKKPSGFLLLYSQRSKPDIAMFQDTSCMERNFQSRLGSFTGTKEKSSEESETCSWRIRSAASSTISLTIKSWRSNTALNCDKHFVTISSEAGDEKICLAPAETKDFNLLRGDVYVEFSGPLVDEKVGFDATFKLMSSGKGERLSPSPPYLFFVTLVLIHLFT